MGVQARRLALPLSLVALASACASPVGVSTAEPRAIQRYLTQSALSGDEPSTFSLIELRRYSLLDAFHDDRTRRSPAAPRARARAGGSPPRRCSRWPSSRSSTPRPSTRSGPLRRRRAVRLRLPLPRGEARVAESPRSSEPAGGRSLQPRPRVRLPARAGRRGRDAGRRPCPLPFGHFTAELGSRPPRSRAMRSRASTPWPGFPSRACATATAAPASARRSAGEARADGRRARTSRSPIRSEPRNVPLTAVVRVTEPAARRSARARSRGCVRPPSRRSTSTIRR